MSKQEQGDARHAARAVLAGRPLNLTSDEVFAKLEAVPGISDRDAREARRVFEAMQIGVAVEAVEKAADRAARLVALVRLARTIRPHVADRQSDWLRFLLALGRRKGESAFQLSYSRRRQSSTAQPKLALERATHTRRALNNMVVAGAILRRIDSAKANGRNLTLKAAIEAAIDDGDIGTDEQAAWAAWQGFRRDCEKLTQGSGTYQLKEYAGPIEKYRGRWVALPEIGTGLSHLPPAKGGRPKT